MHWQCGCLQKHRETAQRSKMAWHWNYSHWASSWQVYHACWKHQSAPEMRMWHPIIQNLLPCPKRLKDTKTLFSGFERVSPKESGLVELLLMMCTSLLTAGESLAPVVTCNAFWKQCWEQETAALANLLTTSDSHFCHTCLQAEVT